MHHRNCLFNVFGTAFLSVACISPAMADDDLSVSVGLRMWSNQWQANTFPVVGGTQIAAHADSGTKLVPIPIISVRYKEFGVSASQFVETNYTLSDGLNPPFDENRSETDINFSYSFMPGISASIGFKEIRWPVDISIKGPTLALSGSAPIGSGLGVYGTAGIGWFETKAPNLQAQKTDYVLGEFGLTYSFDTKSDTLKGLTATVGYRFQKITLKEFSALNNRDINDITSGPTIGLIGRF